MTAIVEWFIWDGFHFTPLVICLGIFEWRIFEVCLFRLADPSASPEQAQDEDNKESYRQHDNCNGKTVLVLSDSLYDGFLLDDNLWRSKVMRHILQPWVLAIIEEEAERDEVTHACASIFWFDLCGPSKDSNDILLAR